MLRYRVVPIDAIGGLVQVLTYTKSILYQRGLQRLKISAAFNPQSIASSNLQVVVIGKSKLPGPISAGSQQPAVSTIQSFRAHTVDSESCVQAKWELLVRHQHRTLSSSLEEGARFLLFPVICRSVGQKE